jgi:hypothetical protein
MIFPTFEVFFASTLAKFSGECLFLQEISQESLTKSGYCTTYLVHLLMLASYTDPIPPLDRAPLSDLDLLKEGQEILPLPL